MECERKVRERKRHCGGERKGGSRMGKKIGGEERERERERERDRERKRERERER